MSRLEFRQNLSEGKIGETPVQYRVNNKPRLTDVTGACLRFRSVANCLIGWGDVLAFRPGNIPTVGSGMTIGLPGRAVADEEVERRAIVSDLVTAI